MLDEPSPAGATPGLVSVAYHDNPAIGWVAKLVAHEREGFPLGKGGGCAQAVPPPHPDINLEHVRGVQRCLQAVFVGEISGGNQRLGNVGDSLLVSGLQGTQERTLSPSNWVLGAVSTWASPVLPSTIHRGGRNARPRRTILRM